MSATVHDNYDELAYHRSHALSASGAKRLLPPNCPALFKHDRDNGGRPNKRAFDFGHAAHAEVLGVGQETVVVHKVAKDKLSVPADDYATQSAQDHKKAIYAEGKIPVLHWELDQVRAMAAAIREHPRASKLLDPAHGKPEVSVFWDDQDRGIDRRARFDWLKETDGGRIVVPDYKTTANAEPFAFSRSMWNFGYDIQATFYTDAIHAAEIAEDVEFLFIAQETKAPYLITIHQFDFEAQLLGRARVDEACRVFKRCTETDTWPGYSDDIEIVPAPTYLADQYLDMEIA